MLFQAPNPVRAKRRRCDMNAMRTTLCGGALD